MGRSPKTGAEGGGRGPSRRENAQGEDPPPGQGVPGQGEELLQDRHQPSGESLAVPVSGQESKEEGGEKAVDPADQRRDEAARGHILAVHAHARKGQHQARQEDLVGPGDQRAPQLQGPGGPGEVHEGPQRDRVETGLVGRRRLRPGGRGKVLLICKNKKESRSRKKKKCFPKKKKKKKKKKK